MCFCMVHQFVLCWWCLWKSLLTGAHGDRFHHCEWPESGVQIDGGNCVVEEHFLLQR
jgi:hypothetical protein